MKASEVRAMPVDELNEKLVDLKEELWQHLTGKDEPYVTTR